MDEAKQSKKRTVPKPSRLITLLLIPLFFLGACRLNAPEESSDAISLMAKYNQQGLHDDAIRIGLEWMKRHPSDHSRDSLFYEQIALTYLMKASKDRASKDEWIRRAASYYDKDLAVHQKNQIDIELYNVARGFEWAGDMSTGDRCFYYTRAIRDFEDQSAFIQGDNLTAYGKTIPLAPVRRENEKALERVKGKLDSASCK